MRNDSVLYRVLYVAYDANSFSLCVYSHFHHQPSDDLTSSQKCQLMGRMSIKKRGRAVGLIENKTFLKLIHDLS